MANINFTETRAYLHDFKFKQLFIDILGWSLPRNIAAISSEVDGDRLLATPIAHLAGIAVFEVSSPTGAIPGPKARKEFHGEVAKQYHENVLIFVDRLRTQSLWYWVKWDNQRQIAREHQYMKGQPGDLFLGKISAMYVDISELDAAGDINVIQVVQRLQKALDVERVTKKFYNDYAEERLAFTELIQGIDDEHDRRWYASVLLNRMMFIFFLQRKGFVDNGDLEYLQRKLEASKQRGKDQYYDKFLKLLFFEGFAKPDENRSAEARQMLGKIRYLSGSIFMQHPVEIRHPNITVPDLAFENLLKLFSSYSWNLNDTPGGQDNEINPDVLGYIFEKYINQKAFGAYYTRTEITEYLCEQTIHRLVLNSVNSEGIPGVTAPRHFDSVPDLLMNLDTRLCRQLLFETLPKLSLLDPACGSGAFLVAAMKTLISIYSGAIGQIEFLNDPSLRDWLNKIRAEHPSLQYFIKRTIITKNLFGVDIMEEATEIARLRLFLALVASADKVEHLEPLPNIDFNILYGNSLIGLLRVDEKAFDRRYQQVSLFQKSYNQLVDEKRRSLEIFRNTSQYTEDLQFMRDEIQKQRETAYEGLNELLLNEFAKSGIKYEEARWDEKQNKEVKPEKRAVQIKDIKALHPFHWGYEFDEVMNERGGFDAIITNPPWEIFKPIAKEFCYQYDPEVERRRTSIKDFEIRLSQILNNPTVRKKYLSYLSEFPHVSAYYRSANQYRNQISVVGNKKAGTDINLYKLFVEQSFNLLKFGGICGIVLPSGIYSDLGTKQLRETLFSQTQINGLFCFENRKEIFEGVHRSFKFLVLTFEKGGETKRFPVAFMKLDVKELASFPSSESMWLSVDVIRRLSPDSLSIMEFKQKVDVEIVEKMFRRPLLGERIINKWNLVLSTDFHMTNDSKKFQTSPVDSPVPLYEGKMIWLFKHGLVKPRYWIRESDAREKFVSPRIRANKRLFEQIGVTEHANNSSMKLGYQFYRLGHRTITGATNERALVVSVIPKNTVVGHSLNVSIPIYDAYENGQWIQKHHYSYPELLFVVAVMSSFICDWYIRQQILTNLTMFYIYQLPVPRLTEEDAAFRPIVDRAAKLLCTTPDYDELAQAVGLESYKNGVTDPIERAKLRAELDGLVARLYDLSEEEFSHILNTFPLIPQKEKDDALEAFLHFSPDLELSSLIASGESSQVEFKQAAFRNPFTKKKDDSQKKNIVEAVAAFMNTSGGTVLIGLADNGKVEGIELEYAEANPRKNNWDGYQLALADTLKDWLKIPTPFAYYQISCHPVAGKVICRIDVQPAPEVVYVEDKLYIREGNRHRELRGADLVKYVNEHWKKLL